MKLLKPSTWYQASGNLLKAIVLVLLGYTQDADASDMLYWIFCNNCEPTIHSEAVQEINLQVGPFSDFDDSGSGGSPGFEPGDHVIIQKSPGSSAQRWKRNTNGTWSESSDAFVCPLFGFAFCLDLTPTQLLPRPP